MKILIADDYGIVRQGLRVLIEQQPDMEVVGEACDGEEVVRLAEQLHPDIVIMDVTMPKMNGIEATRRVLADNPDSKIIALSMYSNRRFVTEMLQAGALGYVLKSYLFDELVRGIEAVAGNNYYLSPRITDVLVEDYVGRGTAATGGGSGVLTKRDREILRLLAEGLSTKQIALKLTISPKTADANRRKIMNKLSIYSVAELTKYAIREGLTSLEV